MSSATSHLTMAQHDQAGTTRARKAVQLNYVSEGTPPHYKNDCAWTSVILPELHQLPRAQKRLVFERLFDRYMLTALEDCRAVNWCPSVAAAMPLNVPGDGNCLLHAVSLFTWGYDDRNLDLRRTIHDALIRDSGNRFRQRWREFRNHANKDCSDSMKVSYDPKTWRDEWSVVFNLVDPEAAAAGHQRLESLEEIHIFALANVLRRPIIVLSQRSIYDVSGVAIQPITMGGIYLPLLCDSFTSCKTPIVIGFADGHFSPLVFIKEDRDDLLQVVPLVHSDMSEFSVNFALPHENPSDLCEEYLELIDIECNLGSRSRMIKAASCILQPPLHQDLIGSYVRYLIEEEQRRQLIPSRQSVSRPKDHQLHLPPVRPSSHIPNASTSGPGDSALVQCATPGCIFFGSKGRRNLCSVCHEKERSRRPPERPSEGRPHPPERPAESRPPQPTPDMHQAPTQQCRTSGCRNFGAKERGYLCFECSQQDNLLRRAEQKKHFADKQVVGQRHCRTSACEFFGDPELNFYCSGCFKKLTIADKARLPRDRMSYRPQSDPINVHPPDPASLPKPTYHENHLVPTEARRPAACNGEIKSSGRRALGHQCTTPGCKNDGNPDDYNMCTDCFAKSIEEYHGSRSPGRCGEMSLAAPPPLPPRRNRDPPAAQPIERPEQSNSSCHPSSAQQQLCHTPGCKFYGDYAFCGYCSGCAKKRPAHNPTKSKASAVLLSELTPCKTKGCALFAPKGSEFCCECQRKAMGDSSRTRMKCRRCDKKEGDAHKSGYCSECWFIQSDGFCHYKRTANDGCPPLQTSSTDVPCMNSSNETV
eukprot:m.307535 g.307535  ORF g.307535 m.307535 type:complete len:816 (+) comp42412_c0_seq1:97-2544(+)